MTLMKISNSEISEFLMFDTDITPDDMEHIRRDWMDIRVVHPNWDRMDCMGELLEVRLPKYGLKAEYTWISHAINLE